MYWRTITPLKVTQCEELTLGDYFLATNRGLSQVATSYTIFKAELANMVSALTFSFSRANRFNSSGHSHALHGKAQFGLPFDQDKYA